MADNALNIQENLCEAINIIANANVNKVKFDSTIECTIIDDSDKLIGKYKVKNESYAEFYAYSQITTYSKDDKVYVQIPKGDYNNTKFIVGKKTDKNEDKPYNFVNPFSTFIDLTGNFYQSKDSNKEIWSILANGDQNEIELTPEGGITFTDEQQGYTRLGLRADFRAWLEALGVKVGNYGLKIDIWGTKNNTAENLESDQLIGTVRLDTSDMYGNPYNFEGYYSQEIIIDISEVAKISKIKIYLYQNNNFKDENNNLITYDIFGNLSVPPNNIFVKDIYMGLGIAADEVENEYVRLYSLDGSTYVIKSDGSMDKKKIVLKWVHFDDNNEKEQITELPEGCIIHWYQYEFGAPSADEYSGVYWDRLDDNRNNFTYELTPRSNKAQEQLKVIILYNNKVYRSNIITFSNEKEVPNDATIDSLNALSLVCKDNSNGNYLIYNQANYLSNRSDSKIERELTLHFNSKTYNIDSDFTKDGSILVEAQKVVWYIPVNSMLSFNGHSTEDISDNYLVIEKDNPKLEDLTLTYTIGNFYSANKSNNTVIAKITKDNIEYTAIKAFTFGQAGTNGTDCTLVIDMIRNENVSNKVLTAVRSGIRDTYYFKAQLYDNQGKEITDFNSASWTWSLSKRIANFTIEDSTSQTCKIRVNTQSSLMDNLVILSVQLKGWGDYDLQASYPIPITTWENTYINGTTEVIYLSDGSPTFNKEPYVLYQNGKEVKDVVWSIIPTLNNATFIGAISNRDGEYRLNPLSFYVKDADQYGIQAKVGDDIIWTQPILVLQNKYPSAMVNKWDGKALLDSENNFLGVAQIAAGKKESNNTFTGVLIGDFGTKQNADSSISYKTGVYGYNNGQQVYSLTDDGKATFGKKSNGQIIIDGSNSKIQAYGYDTGNGGLLIDLKDSKIDGKYNDQSIFTLKKDSPYLKISDINGKILMNVGKDSYYLQSANYTSNGDSGMYIDLANGNITARSGSFKGDIVINYSGSTGSGWSYGNSSLNSILNTIGQAAKEAQDLATESIQWTQDIATAQSYANQAINGLSYVTDILNISDSNNPYLHSHGHEYPKVYITPSDVGIQYGPGIYMSSDAGGNHALGGLLVDHQAVTSDKKFKYDINYDIKRYKDIFFNLKPVSFKFKNLKNINNTLGFIAQDVQEILKEKEIDSLSLVEYNKMIDGLSLDYNSLFVLNIYMLQEAYKEINALELKVSELKEKKE